MHLWYVPTRSLNPRPLQIPSTNRWHEETLPVPVLQTIGTFLVALEKVASDKVHNAFEATGFPFSVHIYVAVTLTVNLTIIAFPFCMCAFGAGLYDL